MADRFPSPFEMPTPPGAEGWQDLYAYSTVFSEDRREYEESAFWFMDGVHSPEVMPPWDATILEYALIALSQYNTRHYVIPPALGVDIRFLNGYMYLSPVGVADPEEIGARVPEFAERAGYYFANWDRLYAAWMPKVRALIDELEAISFSPLPHREDMAVITEGRGTGSAPGPAVHLPPAGRPDPQAVAPPLRVPQPRLRRLPGLLRLLQAAVPVHPGPGHRQDGGRDPGRPVPAGRRGQEAGPARGRARPGRPVRRSDRLRPARGAGRVARRPAGRQVAGGLGGGQAALVQLLGGQRLLPQRQGVAGEPGHPARLPARLHRQGPARRDAGAADGGGHRRARPDRGRVHRADRQRRGPGHVRRQARAGPHRVPVRGEPQLLRRALGPLGDLAQDARPRPGAGGGGVLRRPGRRVPAEQARGARGAVRPATTAGRSACRRAGRSTGRGRWPAGTAS